MSSEKTVGKPRPRKPQPIESAVHPDALLTVTTASALAGRGESTIWRMVAAGEFPQPIRQGPRCTRFRAGDVTRWLQAAAR